MSDWQDDVLAFHEKFDVSRPATPTIPTESEMQGRWALMEEEFEELLCGMASHNMPEIADGIIDLIYTAIGTAIVYGLDLEPLWQEVQKANMTKMLPTDGSYKITKPEGWTAPDIEGVLKAQELNDV